MQEAGPLHGDAVPLRLPALSDGGGSRGQAQKPYSRLPEGIGEALEGGESEQPRYEVGALVRYCKRFPPSGWGY